MSTSIERGSVYWVRLDPVQGSEMAKTRPCVVVSSNEINKRRRTVVIVPLTSTSEPAYFPLVVEMPSAGQASKVRTEQIRAIDRMRLLKLIGQISEEDLTVLSRALVKVLALK